MKRAELDQVVRYEGRLMEVVAIGEGRTVTLRPVGGGDKCEHCGRRDERHLLEHSPLFQNTVKPVLTIKDEP